MIRAYLALACVCTIRAAQENNLTYRNKDVQIFCKPSVLIRWDRNLRLLLDLPFIEPVARVKGYANRFHLAFSRTISREQFTKESKCISILVDFILNMNNKQEKLSTYPTVRQVDGLVSYTLADWKFLPKDRPKSTNGPHMHNHHPRILAAVIVYLYLRLRFAAQTLPTSSLRTVTEETVCTVAQVEARSFQSCKNDLAFVLS